MVEGTSVPGVIFGMLFMVMVLIFLGLGTYGFILFIRLAKRGIKALDIYIKNNSSGK